MYWLLHLKVPKAYNQKADKPQPNRHDNQEKFGGFSSMLILF
jgi:hypothetical protein